MASDSMNALPGLFPEIGGTPAAFGTGVLPAQAIRHLIDSNRITADIGILDAQVQPASLDLRLGPKAYRVQSSFLPGQFSTVEARIRDLRMADVDLTQPAVFEKGCVYIVPLMEHLDLQSDMSAKANPKSSTGRLDIFTRLITDYGLEFEGVREGYRGKLYVEVVSRTFTVLVQEGMRLNQLRFVRGKPPSFDSVINTLDQEERLVFDDEDVAGKANVKRGLRISVNLKWGGPSGIVAYKARKNAPIVDLSKVNHYSPEDFWEYKYSPKKSAVILDPGDFYILASKEKIRVPPEFAAEMVPFDPSIGEIRVHYAGFFDPGFGYGENDIKGTRAVLEVRAHEVPFLIEDGQIVGRLQYLRLLSRPDKIYGVGIGSSYQRQELNLSKQFKMQG